MEFTGIWPLKPDADMVYVHEGCWRRGGWPDPPGQSFSERYDEARAHPDGPLVRRAKIRLLPRARQRRVHAVLRIPVRQPLEKYFDDFVLNGKPNLEAIWGKCIGCPTGADVSARDIVEYIARGQIKTLAVYDVAPGLSNAQIYKAADWYEKAQEVPADGCQGRRPTRGEGRRLLAGAGRALRASDRWRPNRHGCRQRVAVRGNDESAESAWGLNPWRMDLPRALRGPGRFHP